MIDPRTRVLMLAVGLAVLIFVINMVRTRRLQERYALLWLVAGVGLVAAPIAVHSVDRLAYALGIQYPPALLLALAVVALLLIVFQLSLTISHQTEHLKVLTQELGLLRQQVELLAAGKVRDEAEPEEPAVNP